MHFHLRDCLFVYMLALCGDELGSSWDQTRTKMLKPGWFSCTFLFVFCFLEGPLCSWESTGGCSPDDYNTFAGYRDNCLTEECAAGDAGILTWTPDENTPDLVYYHVSIYFMCIIHSLIPFKNEVVIVKGRKEIFLWHRFTGLCW